LENSGLLLGQPAQAFEPQNHVAHVDAHRQLFLTQVVKENPQLQAMIISHMLQHLQFRAAQLAQQQLPPEVMQQIQQLPPDQLQAFQQQAQMIIDQVASPILAQLTAELMESIGQGGADDPLVQIRQQELDLRAAELQQDQSEFQAEEQRRVQEKLLEAEIQRQRMELQKQMADDKIAVAEDRLRQNAELKLMELAQRFGRQQ
ncbi:MAG TPA: hypothetical protein VIG24_07625, partial [Acidimicrobiia bacterium]